MPRLQHQSPKLRRHSTGQAVVTLGGRDHYCGRYGTPESREKYRRLVGGWLSHGCTLPPWLARPDRTLSVKHLIAAYWAHAKVWYRRRDGKPTSALGRVKRVLKDLRRLHGNVTIDEFRPRHSRDMRDGWVRSGYVRSTCNSYSRIVVGVFKWGVEHELVAAETSRRLERLRNLTMGRSEAPEGRGVRPVDPRNVRAALRQCSPTISAMIRLQWRVSCRPDEVCSLRADEINAAGAIWEARPAHHKNVHHGHERVILLGPKAQRIIQPFLEAARQQGGGYVFSPARAEQERLLVRHTARRTPISCGNRPGSNRKRRPKRKARDRYTTDTYGRAIRRACEAAGVEAFSPNRLRHNAATRVRAKHGLEAAQVLLGHRSVTVTQVYAERNLEAARRVAAAVG